MVARKKSTQMLRRDKKQNCSKGKLCGDVCIPKDYECHDEGTGAGVHLYKGGKLSGRATLRGKSASGSVNLANPKVILGGAALYLTGAIAKKVIREKKEDIQTFRQFADDIQFWKKTAIPSELKAAYPHKNSDLNLSLMAAEHKIKDQPFETLYMFDKKGKPLVIRGGSASSASLGITDVFKGKAITQEGNVVTHNHPGGGATFSPTDITTSGRLKLGEMRATTAHEIYILKPKNGATFNQDKTEALASSYSESLTRTLTKAQLEIGKEEFDFNNNPKKAFGNLLYYTTLGEKNLNTKLGRKTEFNLHQDLSGIIEKDFKDDFEYQRIPRYTTQAREKAFRERSDSSIPLDLYHAAHVAITSVYGDIDGYPSIHKNDNALSGIFRDGSQIYDYAITPNGVLTYVEYTRSDAYLIGFSIDSGYSKRQDTATTKKPKKCLLGKPCKNTCVAKGVTCRVQLAPDIQAKLKQTQAKILNFPTLPVSKIAIGLSTAAAFGIGAGYLAHEFDDDPEASVQALTSVYQDALEVSGLRKTYPQLKTKLERFIAPRESSSKVNRKTAKALSGAITMAHVDSEKEKASPGIKSGLLLQGKVSAQERLKYIGKLIDEPARSEDFKIALNKFSDNVKPPPYPEELAALRYYTDSKGYQEMNRTLRGQVDGLQTWLKTEHGDKRSRSQIKADAEQDIKMTTSALNALPNHKGTVYRGLTLPESAIPKTGEAWNEKGFTSTTKNAFTRYPGNVAMVIQSKSGKDITAYEKYKNDEVLFKPNTSFTVTEKRKVKKFGKEFYLIKMQQVD